MSIYKYNNKEMVMADILKEEAALNEYRLLKTVEADKKEDELSFKKLKFCSLGISALSTALLVGLGFVDAHVAVANVMVSSLLVSGITGLAATYINAFEKEAKREGHETKVKMQDVYNSLHNCSKNVLHREVQQQNAKEILDNGNKVVETTIKYKMR
jgi:hypothetical protein